MLSVVVVSCSFRLFRRWRGRGFGCFRFVFVLLTVAGGGRCVGSSSTSPPLSRAVGTARCRGYVLRFLVLFSCCERRSTFHTRARGGEKGASVWRVQSGAAGVRVLNFRCCLYGRSPVPLPSMTPSHVGISPIIYNYPIMFLPLKSNHHFAKSRLLGRVARV